MASPLGKRAVLWTGAVALVAVGVLLIASPWLSRRVRTYLEESLQKDFASELKLQRLNVRLFPSVRIDGEGLVLRYKGRTDLPPLITIRRFSGVASLAGLLRSPVHIRQMRVEGLQIQVPPRGQRSREESKSGTQKPDFVIDEMVADGTKLTMIPKSDLKVPLEWDILRLTLYGAGPSTSMSFRATLTNGKPPGQIESSGKFGPWQKEEPGNTAVSGTYTFQNADLSVFRGISGKLSSEGNYYGVLDRIQVEGHTDTPDFAVKVSGNPVHLTTQFQAVVDGTDGNTWLQPVNAQFGHSSVTARGGVEGIKGVPGKTISLDVTAPEGHLEDMLLLGVKGKQPAMSGRISFHTKLVIPPGDVDIANKLKLDGSFIVGAARFSKLNVQEKVNQLSHRGSGDPQESATDTVASDFSGHFTLDDGLMTFKNLSFRVPGVSVALNGNYGLLGQQMEFRGSARLDAKLSQTTTGFKSFLLKAVDPFFEKKNAGAVLPIKIGGTRDNPSFGLDLR
jgi:hypothetical protein